ncbi:flagellar biosynthesis anti-sigma factor FlgM [Thioalkalivibrio sp.]|uniref:flagellar biosynthesis anti-sigma factor FlgM n=1 Tax=Thioalkalivibrio sp. TaxID=2093813 RepID=UPI003975A558
MSMELKNLTQTQARAANEGRSVAENRPAPGSDGGASRRDTAGGDQVTLTDTARRLSDLTQTVSDQPAVDRGRVDEIRRAIQEGRYEVNAERVADRLLQTEALL